MLLLKTVLYHGTISEINHIDVSQGRDKKDFGKGFYMATTKFQAVGMMHKKFHESCHRYPEKKFTEHLYEIVLNSDYLQSLNIKFFKEADQEWLNFILNCREKGGTPHDYDIVVGPTADDNTMLCLKTYLAGFYGDKNSIEAKEILLHNLEVENLDIQYFVSKQNVADKLIKSVEEIGWN